MEREREKERKRAREREKDDSYHERTYMEEESAVQESGLVILNKCIAMFRQMICWIIVLKEFVSVIMESEFVYFFFTNRFFF
jgi:hypothetical protein